GRVAAAPALESVLRRPVGLFAVAALVAGAAGVSRVHGHHRDAGERGLVRDELTKLMETPSRHLRPLLPAEPGSLPDALEFFGGDAAPSVFGLGDELLGDDVVDIAAESLLAAADPPHGAPGVFSGAPAVAVLLHLPPQRAADAKMFLADVLDGLAAECLAVTGGGDVGHAQVHADEVGSRDGRAV